MEGEGDMVWGAGPAYTGEGDMHQRPAAHTGFATFQYEETGAAASPGPPLMSGGDSFGGMGMGSAHGGSGSGHVMSSGVDDEEELPILEELGINLEHIRSKALSVLNPFKIQDTEKCKEYIEDDDLAGPVCFAVLLGVSMMLEGKMHFGHIYGMNPPPLAAHPFLLQRTALPRLF
eukprot:Rhum_TRINITY_DN9724_c0_g1::Rhum_TRINITY_DN9724_c0_g1_i1::g.34909::m.34909/K20363/YIP1, YIPF5; protein transport protein YIP1